MIIDGTETEAIAATKKWLAESVKMLPDMNRLANMALQDGFSMTARIVRQYSAQEIIRAGAKLTSTTPIEMASIPVMGYVADGIFDKNILNPLWLSTQDICENIEGYEWVYNRLSDENSRHVFNCLVLYRLLPHNSLLAASCDSTTPEYFDKSIVNCDENEVFVACGGYTGDTVLSYIQNMGAYKRIYVYEPSTENFSVMCGNLRAYKNIVTRHAGVGEKSGTLSFTNFVGMQDAGTFIHADEGGEKIPVVSLDEDIAEAITFIEMDIEGFEKDALKGAARHLREEKPKLAISLYHFVGDMREIPHLIHSINPKYKFYIRQYQSNQNWGTVLYAV